MKLSGDGVRVAQPLFPVDGQGSIPMSPLQLKFEQCGIKCAIELNKLWHSRMPELNYQVSLWGGISIAYVAEFKNYSFAVSIWTRPIAANRMKHGTKILELRRMAIADDAPKNTASRFISWMVKDIKKLMPDIIKLISYQDTYVHTGTIYKASGWKIGSKSNYIPWTEHTDKRKAYGLEQSDAPKNRWEKQIRPEPEILRSNKTEVSEQQLKLF